MDLLKLKEPFAASDIEWRVQSSGEKSEKIWAMVLAYVTNRAIMDRLDEVCSPENWQNRFKDGPGGGVLCGISIRVGTSPDDYDNWVTKWDGADNTQVEAVKGGLSGAMKRAAVQWGIGRYLYKLDVGWADIVDKGSHSDKTKSEKLFKWNPPSLPAWALPSSRENPLPQTTEKPTNNNQNATGLENRVKGMLAIINEAPGLFELDEYLTAHGKEIKAMPQKYQTQLKTATFEMRQKFEWKAEAETSGQPTMPMDDGGVE
jgi:hypothetical protein